MNAGQSEIPEYELYVDEIVKCFSHQMIKEFDLFFEGDGGSMPHDVESIRISFNAHRRASIEEARKIELYATEKLLKMINVHQKIKPFLREYPFTPQRVEICISFSNKHGPFRDGTVGHVSMIRGNIVYRAYDPVSEQSIDLLRESYAEALKIVPTTLLDAAVLRVHNEQSYEKHMDKLLLDFAKEVDRKWGLSCQNGGGKWVNGIEEVAIRFYGSKNTPVEKARELHVAISERLCEIINADAVIRPYLKEYPFPISRIRNCIHFYRKPYYRSYYEDGSVAYVEQDKDKVLYFTEQPWIGNRRPVNPVPLAQESYESAKKLVQKK